MSKYKVFVSIPGTYDGMILWVEADSVEHAEAQVRRLLNVVMDAETAPDIVVD